MLGGTKGLCPRTPNLHFQDHPLGPSQGKVLCPSAPGEQVWGQTTRSNTAATAQNLRDSGWRPTSLRLDVLICMPSSRQHPAFRGGSQHGLCSTGASWGFCELTHTRGRGGNCWPSSH